MLDYYDSYKTVDANRDFVLFLVQRAQLFLLVDI
jgi:hypothetical protein